MRVGGTQPLIVATVGLSEEPFSQLVDWVGTWLVSREERVRAVVQHGTTPPPPLAACAPVLPFAELQMLLQQAHVVICAGGQRIVTEARAHGHIPVVVPRPQLLTDDMDRWDELVDLAASGRILLATDYDDFDAALARSLDAPRVVLHPAAGGRANRGTGDVIALDDYRARRAANGPAHQL